MTPGGGNREWGAAAEQYAEAFLTGRGLIPVERNYRCRNGEIDLVMRDLEVLVFVEVRFRSNPRFGIPAETVTVAKQRKIIAAARHFLQSRRIHDRSPCRFDVIAVSGPGQDRIDWIRDAFQPAG